MPAAAVGRQLGRARRVGAPPTRDSGSVCWGKSYRYIDHGSAHTSNQRIAIPRPTSLWLRTCSGA